MSYIPDTLPEKPVGFTRHLVAHFNYGRKGGAATYEIKDPEGRVMPFWYQYDTRKGKEAFSGFAVKERDSCMTWAQLVAYWPEYIALLNARAQGE